MATVKQILVPYAVEIFCFPTALKSFLNKYGRDTGTEPRPTVQTAIRPALSTAFQ